MAAAKKRVTFAISAPEASAVLLGGTFNGWEPEKTPLKKDAKGNWKALVMLEPGTYQYRLVVDGEWVNDPSAEATVPNGLGSYNCVKEVVPAA